MYRVDILVQRLPGKAVCHRGVGWSTVALLRSPERTIQVDIGSFGMRKLLAKHLEAHGVAPADVPDVVLTHAHYDHLVNFTLFDRARMWIGSAELAWAQSQPPGFDPLPELRVHALANDSKVRRIESGEVYCRA